MLRFPKLLKHLEETQPWGGGGNSDGQRGSWNSWDSVGAHHHAVSAQGGVSEVECVTETQEAWAMDTK